MCDPVVRINDAWHWLTQSAFYTSQLGNRSCAVKRSIDLPNKQQTHHRLIYIFHATTFISSAIRYMTNHDRTTRLILSHITYLHNPVISRLPCSVYLQHIQLTANSTALILFISQYTVRKRLCEWVTINIVHNIY